MAPLSHTARHDAGVRLRVPVLVLALLLPVALLSGCGGHDPKPATGPGLPSQAALRSYFAAITSGEADQVAKARTDVAAPGSLADGYAAYVEETDQAASADGQEPDPVDVEEIDGGFKACIAADQCVTWTDLSGQGGRLADFSTGRVKLSDSLIDLTAQAPIRSAGLYQVQPEWAYRVPSGTLNVIVTVTASDVPLSPKAGTYIAGDQILKGDKDVYPATVDAGTSSPVVLSFLHAKDVGLDGQITFGLKLGDQSTESIGFGLADPAAS